MIGLFLFAILYLMPKKNWLLIISLVIGFLVNPLRIVYAVSPSPAAPQEQSSGGVSAQGFLDSILGWMNQKSFNPFIHANIPLTPVPSSANQNVGGSSEKGASTIGNDAEAINNYYLANGFRTPNPASTTQDWLQQIKDKLGFGNQQGDDFLRTFVPTNIADQYKNSSHDRYFRTAQCVGLPFCDGDNLPTWTDTPQAAQPAPTGTSSTGGQ